MAEISGSGAVDNSKYWTHTWEGLANGDTGKAVRVYGIDHKTVQVAGTFGAGGELTFQGSMDGTNWFTLTNNQGGNDIFTSAAVSSIQEMVKYVRPNVTGGDGTTSLTVIVGGSALV